MKSTKALIMAIPWDVTRSQRAYQNVLEASPARIVWDLHHSAWDTWSRTLAAAGEEAVIVMEDDIVLAPEFRRKVDEAIAQRPDEVIQFFSLRKSDLEKGSRKMAGSSFLMNQCHYLPKGAAADLYRFSRGWYEENHEEHPSGTDTCTSQWLKARKMKYWLHVPSLVQHEQWTSEINPRRARTRQSPTFGRGTR